MKTVTRNIGECQWCGADHKLFSDNTVVHHGYKRPGDGQIHGDCFGVGAVPYEVSCDLTKKLVSLLQGKLVGAKAYLERLKNGGVRFFMKQNRHGEAVQFAVGVTNDYDWNREIESATWNVESEIRHLTSEITIQEKRVANWVAKPIRTVEEMERLAQVGKDARKAERDAKRAEKNAKIAATKAKQAALQEKRDAIVKAYAEQFIALADDNTLQDADRKNKAFALAREKAKTKMQFFWVQDLEKIPGFRQAVLALGVATSEPNLNCLRYSSMFFR